MKIFIPSAVFKRASGVKSFVAEYISHLHPSIQFQTKSFATVTLKALNHRLCTVFN